MNKNEILARSRKENHDERDQYIVKMANANSYLAVIIVFATLSIILFVQKLITGKAFADIRVFTLAFLVGMVGHSVTVYYYNRDKKVHLVSVILGTFGALIYLASIIGTGMGWF